MLITIAFLDTIKLRCRLVKPEHVEHEVSDLVIRSSSMGFFDYPSKRFATIGDAVRFPLARPGSEDFGFFRDLHLPHELKPPAQQDGKSYFQVTYLEFRTWGSLGRRQRKRKTQPRRRENLQLMLDYFRPGFVIKQGVRNWHIQPDPETPLEDVPGWAAYLPVLMLMKKCRYEDLEKPVEGLPVGR